MFLLKTIMTFGLVLHLGGPLDAAMVLLGFQEPPAQVLRCVDNPAACQMEVASLSIASTDWSVSGEQSTSGEKLGLRLSTAGSVQSSATPALEVGEGSVIARPIGLNAGLAAFSRGARVSNGDM